jgi:hypothetical protein
LTGENESSKFPFPDSLLPKRHPVCFTDLSVSLAESAFTRVEEEAHNRAVLSALLAQIGPLLSWDFQSWGRTTLATTTAQNIFSKPVGGAYAAPGRRHPRQRPHDEVGEKNNLDIAAFLPDGLKCKGL